jgi:peptide/nickel transport system ATP-binding protein
MSVLEVRGLTVDYRQRGAAHLRAVDNLSMSLRAGQTLALVGESGSGKSTVVRALAHFVRPTSGEILLNGAPTRYGRNNAEYRQRLQIVFQDPFASLNPMHTVEHHLRRPLAVHGGPKRGPAMREAVHELLASVNLVPAADFAAKRPHELSGGQRQRVAIARALATNPDVLLADEPVSMLDVSIRLEILNLLDRLKRERDLALLYVTHDLATARHFAAEIMVMYRGQVVESGPSDAVILAPAHPYTQLLASAAPDRTRSRADVVAARAARLALPRRTAELREGAFDDGCRFRTRCPHAMDICASRPPEIEIGSAQVARCWLHDPTATAAARLLSADPARRAAPGVPSPRAQ